MRAAHTEVEEFEVRAPFGGLADGVTADVLQEADLSHVRNFDFDRRGLTKRFGRSMVNTLPDATEPWALQHFRSDIARKLFLVAGAHLILIPENGSGAPRGAVSGVWPAGAADVIGGGSQMGAFVQFRDDLFYADGNANPQFYQGSSNTIGIWGYQGGALPAPTDTGDVAGGALTAGAWYGVAYAYRDPARALSTNPSTPLVTFQADAVNLTEGFTAPSFGGYNNNFSEVIVLRTLACPDEVTARSATLRYEKTIAGVNTASFPLAFTVSVADDRLESWEGGSDNGPPPEMDFITLFDERIVGFHKSTVYHSKDGFDEEGGVHSFPVGNVTPVETGAGDDIGCIFVMQGQLYAAKEGAGVFLLAEEVVGESGLFTFKVQKITGAAVGCLARFGVAVIENTAYWIDDKGVVEFDGNNARIITEEPAPGLIGVRDTFAIYRAAGRLRDAYVCVDRQPFKHVVRWKLWRHETDSLGNLQIVSDEIIYDLVTRRWTVHHAGGDPAVVRTSGIFDKLVCYSGTGNAGGSYRDGDGASHVYVADEDGNVYRLETDEAGEYVYSDNGEDFAAECRTKFFGNGIDLQAPLNIDVEVQRSRLGKNVGNLALYIYRDGVDGPSKSETFELWDESQSTDATKSYALNADRMPCRRWAIGLKHSASDGDLTVLRLRGRAKILGRTLRGK